MKNIEAILKDFGIEIPEDKKESFVKAVNENYKTINDWQNQKDKADNLQTQLNTTKEDLKKFEGIDPDKLNSEIASLTKKLEEKDVEYQSQIADRDFNDLLNGTITEKKGLNAKAITALLDIDTLKKSKNQKEDIAKAVDELIKAEDSKMLFGSNEPDVLGNISPIGKVGKNPPSSDLSKMRAIMGLPPENNNNN